MGIENKQTNGQTGRQAGMLADTLSTAQYGINMWGFWDEADLSYNLRSDLCSLTFIRFIKPQFLHL